MPGDRRTAVKASFDEASRAHALHLADQIGDQAAAAAVGCAPSTIRAWRHRASAKDAARPKRDTDAPPTDMAEPDDLLTLAGEARLDAATARQRMHQALEAGRAQDARALGQLLREAHERANGLDASLRLEREHRVRLEQAQAQLRATELRLMTHLWKLFIQSIGVPWSQPVEDGMTIVLKAFTSGEMEDGKLSVKLPTHELAPARAAVQAALLRHHDQDDGSSESSGTSVPLRAPRDELDALDQDVVREIEQAKGDPNPQGLQAAPPQNPGAAGPRNPVAVSPAEALAGDALPAEDAPAEDPDLPLWTDLPVRWKRLLDHDLARREFRGELQREERRRKENAQLPPRPSRHIIPRHPGLADLLS